MDTGDSDELGQTHASTTLRDSGEIMFVPGNSDAYAQLFSRYAPRVKGYMLRRGLSHETAEELTQEVMLTVWRKAETYDAQRASLSTWLFTIARNRCIDQLRRSMRPVPDPQDPCWVDTVSAPTGPEARVMKQNRSELVRGAVAGLDHDQRRALQQLYFEGQTTAEAARTLGVPVGTVKSRARRALEALRKRLRDGGGDDA